MKRVWIFAVVLVIIAAVIWRFYRASLQTSGDYRPRESKLALNPSQQAEMPNVEGDLLTVFREKSPAGVWQVRMPGEAATPGATPVGALHAQKVTGSVENPLYLCEFPTPRGPSRSLDPKPDCGGAGKAVSAAPVGYVSQLIRTGYLLAVRCSTPDHGYYVSLNARCESPKDRFSAMLGAMRAAEVVSSP